MVRATSRSSSALLVLACVLLAAPALAQTTVTTTDKMTAFGNLTISPVGDVVFDAAGKDIVPNLNYDQNLGMLNKKYLTLHAAELWVETLVAQNTIATMGGRILVGPTTPLAEALAAGDNHIHVKYNNLANGDRVYLEAGGQVEFLAVTSSAGGSAGNYTYNVTRNLDGTGANDWLAGDAVFNTGQTGTGFIDLYALRGVKAASEAGPTIVGNVRNSATYNDWSPRWAMGNLNGLYGFSGSTYGFAAGDYSKSWVTANDTDGLKMGYGATPFVSITPAGVATINGSLTVTANGLSNTTLAAYGKGGAVNQVKDPGFEAGTGAGWIEYDNCSQATGGVTQTWAYEGTWSWYTYWAGTANGSCTLGVYTAEGQRTAWLPNTTYVVSFYARTYTTPSTTSAMSLAWNHPPTTEVLLNPNLTTSFQRYAFRLTWDGTVESGCTGCLFITMSNSAQTTNYIIIDAVKVEAGAVLGEYNTPVSAIPPGTIAGDRIVAGSITADRISTTSLSALSANLGTITAGSISGVTGSFSGSVTAGTATLSSGELKWGGNARVYGGNDYVDVANASYFQAQVSGSVSLGNSGVTTYVYGPLDLRTMGSNHEILFDPPSTTYADYPMVWSAGNHSLYYKTDGIGTLTCGAGTFANVLYGEYGIITAVDCAYPAPDPTLTAEVELLKQEVAQLKAALAQLLAGGPK